MPDGAIFHVDVQTIKRSEGRSAVAAAAYRAGTRLVDVRTGTSVNYTRKRGVLETFIAAPDGCDWITDRQTLWNAAEAAENRSNSVVAREWMVALPSALDAAQRASLARALAVELVTRYGVAVDVALHAPAKDGDERNFHAHLLTTTREVTPDGLGDKTRILDAAKTGGPEIAAMRKWWQDTINDALEAADKDVRVDHRPRAAIAKERGEPAPEVNTHDGPALTAFKRRQRATEPQQAPVQEAEHGAAQIASLLDAVIDHKAAQKAREASPAQDVAAPPTSTQEQPQAPAPAHRTPEPPRSVQAQPAQVREPDYADRKWFDLAAWDGRLDVTHQNLKFELVLSLPRAIADRKKLAEAGWHRRAVSPLGQDHFAAAKQHDANSASAVMGELAAVGLDTDLLRAGYRPIREHARMPFVARFVPFFDGDAVFQKLRALETQIGFLRPVKGRIMQSLEDIHRRLKERFLASPDHCDTTRQIDNRGEERNAWSRRIGDWGREHLAAFIARIEAEERHAERLAAETVQPPSITPAPGAKPSVKPEQPKPQASRPSSGGNGRSR